MRNTRKSKTGRIRRRNTETRTKMHLGIVKFI
jgi:hypothetical protein